MAFTQDLLAKTDPRCLVHGCKSTTGCTRTFTRNRATFSLAGSPSPHALLDFDKPPLVDPNVSRCDFLFAADGKHGNAGWLVFLEMTSGKKAAGKISRQIQSGMALVADLVPRNLGLEVRAVVVGSMSRRERRALNSPACFVQFHGMKPQAVGVISGGGMLATALDT